MSRLTASPFAKPSPLDFIRHPLTPPETTTSEHHTLSQSISVAAIPELNRPYDAESYPSTQLPQDPGARFRKVSSLAYHSSGLRDARERPGQKSFKSFIIVTPPSSFLHEYGQLGHTLSSGPSHRLGQGLLMPLFPTMYAQLTAIAREFNFPSTAGLCIYLHYFDNGVTCTPRISDDTWSHLWNSMFDGSSSSNSKLPICGKIEFDIDLQHARWYGAWVASSQRSIIETKHFGRGHIRGESRATFTDDRTVDEQSERPQRAASMTHVPRKLSLVDRFDAISSVTTSRPMAPSPPENTPSRALSPIFQSEEPRSSKNELEFRVKSWRASAQLDPTPLAAMGQTSLEPANMPNDLELAVGFSAVGEEEPLRLEDFAWSLSSNGPGSDLHSPVSSSRIPSVHIAGRVEGSVCLTPSVVTSFGPSDYTLSPLSAASFRAPSPDIAQMFYEDCPVTPTTATSWGPASVQSNARWYDESDGGFSIDIAQRMIFSRPETPCTATSWGPTSWPSSPFSEFRAPSVDLAARGVFSRPATPLTATSWGAPLSYPPSPTTPFYVSTPDAGQRNFDIDAQRNAPWSHVWPYTSNVITGEQERAEAQRNGPWSHVWPYTSQVNRGDQPGSNVATESGPWHHVWPYTSKSDQSVNVATTSPWTHVWPYFGCAMERSYSRVIYPYFNLYPFVEKPSVVQQPVSVKCPVSYPNFDLYDPVYPHSVTAIYEPSRAFESEEVILQVGVGSRYPTFDLYPNVYPFVTPYPSLSYVQCHSKFSVPKSSLEVHTPIDVKVGSHYPTFDLYPAVYPFVVPYPSVLSMDEPNLSMHSYGYPDFVLYLPLAQVSIAEKEISCAVNYPIFDLYPAVYPHFNLYSSVCSLGRTPASSGIPKGQFVSVQLPVQYPLLDLYRPVYPHFELYPALSVDVLASRDISITRQRTRRMSCVYPVFDLYPAVYPDFELYPVLPVDVIRRRNRNATGTRQSRHFVYPVFDLYPAVYPHFELYPPLPEDVLLLKDSNLATRSQTPTCVYPTFNLYPALYPYFSLYRDTYPVMENLKNVGFVAKTVYPYLSIYPVVYPHFELWLVPSASIMHPRRRTHKELHRIVIATHGLPKSQSNVNGRPRKTHQQLHNEVWSIPAYTSPVTPSPMLRRPARPRSRAGSVIGLPPAPPPTRGLPPVTAPPTRGLPDTPPSSTSLETTSPSRRMGSTVSDVPLSSRPNVYRTQSLSNRSHSYGKRDLPKLPSVDETVTRSSSLKFPLEITRSDSGAGPRPPRKRDSLVLQRVKAINSGLIGEEVHDVVDTFPVPPTYIQRLDHTRYSSK